jgi:hypothetical protein
MHRVDTFFCTGQNRRGMGSLGGFDVLVALFSGDKDAED